CSEKSNNHINASIHSSRIYLGFSTFFGDATARLFKDFTSCLQYLPQRKPEQQRLQLDHNSPRLKTDGNIKVEIQAMQLFMLSSQSLVHTSFNSVHYELSLTSFDSRLGFINSVTCMSTKFNSLYSLENLYLLEQICTKSLYYFSFRS